MSPSTDLKYAASFKAPLLMIDEESDIETICPQSSPSPAAMNTFKRSSTGLGLVTGMFLQMCTLGVNYLLMTIWDVDFLSADSSKEVIVASLIWSFLTAVASCSVMALLRDLVLGTATDSALHEELILHMECRFAAGALMGLCFAWTATDIVLGTMTGVCLLSTALTLGVALACCRAMLWYFSTPTAVAGDDGEAA